MSRVHVIPVGDLIIHDASDDCVCVPRAELVQGDQGDEWVMVHNSLDGREKDEQ